MEVSVIVPVHNDAVRLGQCLAALKRQTVMAQYEVVVIDNGSTDDIRSIVSDYPAVRYLREDRPGSYAARNRGVTEARGRVLAFTDSDCRPSPTWLERGVARIEKQADPVFVGGPVQVTFGDPVNPTALELFESLHAFPQRHYIESCSFSVTANLLVSASLFATVGAFDATLLSSGDREWGQRAARLGVLPFFDEMVSVSHPARRSLREINYKLRRVYAGDVQLKNNRGEARARFDPRSLLPPTLSTVRDLAKIGPLAPSRKLAYAGTATAVHYLAAYHRNAAAFRMMRAGE